MAGTVPLSREDPRADPTLSLAPPLTDWTLRPFTATSLSPVWVGLGIALAYFALAVGFYGLLAALGWEFDARGATLSGSAIIGLEILNGVILAYLPTALFYLRRGALRDLRELRPVLRCSDAEFDGILESVVCASSQALHRAGLLGAVLFIVVALYDPSFWLGGRRPPLLDPGVLFVLARHGLMGFLAGRAVLTEVHMTKAYVHLGVSSIEIDLLDLRPLRPFARKGLRSAFTWILVSSLVSLFWLSPFATRSNVPLLALILGLVTASFVSPLRGVHRGIRAAKEARLDRVRREIRSESEAVLRPGEGEGARLANLIAYRGLLEGIPEWPLDVPTLLRFLLFLAVDVGSWLGGAVVERALERALG